MAGLIPLNPETVVHLTPEELAKRWNMKPGTLSKWRQRGCGPDYIQPVRKILYPIEAIEAFEKSRRRRAVSVPL